MAKYRYHCNYCNFRTNDLDEYGTHEQACAEEQTERERELLGDYYWKLDMLRDDARVPSELIELLHDLVLEVRRLRRS